MKEWQRWERMAREFSSASDPRREIECINMALELLPPGHGAEKADLRRRLEEAVSRRTEEGDVVLLPIGALDADGDVLSYHLASSDAGFSIDPATGLLRFDSHGLGPKTYTALVVVSDGSASAQQSISVTVEGAGSIPVAALLAVGLVMVLVVALVLAIRR